MKIAIISDIHSNSDALDGVLQDIKARGIDRIYATGDLVGYLAFPNEVVTTIRDAGITSILGNHDKAIIEAICPEESAIKAMSEKQLQASASRIYTLLTLTSHNKAFLAELPEDLIIECDDLAIKLVHGSPDRIDEYLYEDSEALATIADIMTEDVLVFGHTHLPFHKVVKGKHFINAGSVGKPKHGNANSTYVVLNTDTKVLDVTIVEVPYDRSRIKAAIKASPLISDTLIEALEKGR